MEVSTELAIRSALVDALDKIFFPIESRHNMAQLDASCITYLGTMFRLWPTFVLAWEKFKRCRKADGQVMSMPAFQAQPALEIHAVHQPRNCRREPEWLT